VRWTPPIGLPASRLRCRALVADDEANARRLLSSLLATAGYEVETASGGEEALDLLDDFAPHLILADVELPAIGQEPADLASRLIRALGEQEEAPTLILLARSASIPAAIRGLAAGADCYLTKPVDADRLRLLAERLVDHHRLRGGVDRMRVRLRGLPALRRLVGQCPKILELRAALAQAVESRAPVLISGERGTGKLLAAELLHECRAPGGRLESLPCAGLTPVELDSAVVSAGGGTLFLDEVSDLPPETQERLADFLAWRTAPGPAARGRRPNACIVAATRRDLGAEVEAGAFSLELLELLRSIALVMPPLRERELDVLVLADHFSRELPGHSAWSAGGLPRAAGHLMADLLGRNWPGNVDELKRFVEHGSATGALV